MDKLDVSNELIESIRESYDRMDDFTFKRLMRLTSDIRKTHIVKRWALEVKARNAKANNNRWTCTKCRRQITKKYDVIAHHIYGLPFIVQDFIRECKWSDKWSDKCDFISKLFMYGPLTDLSNGRVMCRKCHDKHHGREPAKRSRRKPKVINSKRILLTSV